AHAARGRAGAAESPCGSCATLPLFARVTKPTGCRARLVSLVRLLHQGLHIVHLPDSRGWPSVAAATPPRNPSATARTPWSASKADRGGRSAPQQLDAKVARLQRLRGRDPDERERLEEARR